MLILSFIHELSIKAYWLFILEIVSMPARPVDKRRGAQFFLKKGGTWGAHYLRQKKKKKIKKIKKEFKKEKKDLQNLFFK